MTNWSIHLEEQTATSKTGICFKFTETSLGVLNAIINPEVIPPDDIDKVILSGTRDEAKEDFAL